MCDKLNDVELQLATACDVANTWAREIGVEQCENPYTDLGLRDLIKRIWNKTAPFYLTNEKIKISYKL